MSPALLSFLGYTVGISLSGVMAPGPVTAATLAAGTRSKHAGGLIAVGHGIVEFPLMLVVMAGTGALFQSRAFTIGVGLVGGAFLVWLGVQMLRGLRAGGEFNGKWNGRHPVWVGVILTAGNPYFLVWWATTGLLLTSRALELGAVAFGLFALVHWLCDLIWLEVLSQASFRGTRLIGRRAFRVVLGACSVGLIVIGLNFMQDAARKWW